MHQDVNIAFFPYEFWCKKLTLFDKTYKYRVIKKKDTREEVTSLFNAAGYGPTTH